MQVAVVQRAMNVDRPSLEPLVEPDSVSGSPDSMQYHVFPCLCGIGGGEQLENATERCGNSLLASAWPTCLSNKF
jgi:hypothetical protein